MVRVRVSSHKKQSKRRTFSKIRYALLKNLALSQKNIRELATTSKVNWRTTRDHMIFFLGMGYAREVFSSPQVRIFEITQKGMEALVKNEI
jgi:predicted transcriptional regulator